MPISYFGAILDCGRMLQNRESSGYRLDAGQRKIQYSLSKGPSDESITMEIYDSESFDYNGFRGFIRGSAEQSDIIGEPGNGDVVRGAVRVEPGEKECYLVRFPFNRNNVVTLRNDNYKPDNQYDEVMEFFGSPLFREISIGFASITRSCGQTHGSPAYTMEFRDSRTFGSFMHSFAIAHGELD